jgi:hypothetical protein
MFINAILNVVRPSRVACYQLTCSLDLRVEFGEAKASRLHLATMRLFMNLSL